MVLRVQRELQGLQVMLVQLAEQVTLVLMVQGGQGALRV